MSRRAVLGGTAALGVGLPLVGVGAGTAVAAPRLGGGQNAGSTRAAVGFLQGVIDAYRVSGPRMAQSYYDGSGLLDVGFTYDNALTTIALLDGGDVVRARAIGDALLLVQEADGRLRQAYFVNRETPVVAADPFGFTGTAVGDMAWAGVALAQLARATGLRQYRDGAVKIGTWIYDNTYSTTGLGGYTFGLTAGLEDHKSTEHNIDVYALFRLLARLTRNPEWTERAEHAWDFVEALWNAADGFFWTGSDDGSTINTKPTQLPLDPQPWSWLAARDRRYAGALDWAKTNLATTDTPLRINSELSGNYSVTGVTFSSGGLIADVNAPIDPFHGKPDDGAVWFEGTSQMALALNDRDRRGDREDADRLLAAVRSAQGRLGVGQTFGGKQIAGGIVAASSPLNTGFGFGYYQHLHIGATSWFVFASLGENPYRF
ncbi:MAG TPA: hypothetical protein VIT42_02905 [Microlunatus sp.]